MCRIMLLVTTLCLVGCGSPSATAPATGAVDEHGHTSTGPHGGAIIELGEYHGELVHDDAAGTVTVFVLDGAAAKNVPVDATEAVINITREGLAKQFNLPASPVEGEPEGWSSRFVSSEVELAKELDNPGAAAVFVVSINGQQHRGMVEHHHDHDHDHAGHHHEGDDALIWQRSDIQHADYLISIGHHSKLLHAGEPMEPAVSITINGNPVSDAQVFNSLWSGDGKMALVEEVRAIYEPPTAAEPAHYAQGSLDIPSDAKNVVVRFRIVLPGNADDVFYDMPVATGHADHPHN